MTGTQLLHSGVLLRADEQGDLDPAQAHGLFRADTRYLSRWRFTVDGDRPERLASTVVGVRAEHTLVPYTVRGQDPAWSVRRIQAVDPDGLAETVQLTNHRTEPVTLILGYELDADFADQFELRTDRRYDKPGGRVGSRVHPDGVTLTYRREEYTVDSQLRCQPHPSEAGPAALRWRVTLDPHAQYAVRLRIGPPPATIRDPERIAVAARAGTAGWLSTMDSDRPGDALARWARQGRRDLAALQMPAPGHPQWQIIAAGAPWFLTLFGRDSLITAYALLPYRPQIAADTLRTLAAYQGTVLDPDRVEEPGKIVHEVRPGELSRFGQVPYARYYGTVDATPLFLILLGEYHRQTGDAALARELAPAARAAVGWMVEHGGLGRDGYLRYPTDRPGLVNHGWKDSPRAICFPDGEPARGPVAVCEVQGYAYHALTVTARLASEVWQDAGYAADLTARARDLRTRFQADFWTRRDYVALALDGDDRPLETVTSNPGHLLWSGLLEPDRAGRVADRLTQPDLLTRWGIRTLASGQPAFHPISYHNGSVWPHDTALIVHGLARAGRSGPAHQVADRLIEAAQRSGYRLPEVLTGHDGVDQAAPLPYPYACSPQAWAAASPLLLASSLDRRG